MSAHTPGPWHAGRNSSYWEVCPENGGENGIPFSVADTCSSAPGHPDGGLQEANARLIAAAPELLEALEDFLSSSRALCLDHMLEKEMQNASAAIKKAKGETQ